MLALLSPAKTLDYTSAIPAIKPTQPALLAESEKLIKALRKLKHPSRSRKLRSFLDT